MRVGIGFDLHRLGADRPLRLGGIEIPDSPGLIGHSDADCVLHAVADAMLGAAGFDDIGAQFPDDDPEWKDADSAKLVASVLHMIGSVGYRLINVDCTVIAEWPKLAPFREEMRYRMAQILELDEDAVGVKYTTSEKIGALGRGEGIACHAVCLLEQSGLDME